MAKRHTPDPAPRPSGIDIGFPDPVTSWALAIIAVAEMITEVSRGQPQDVKTKMWQRFIEFDDRVRKFFGITDPPATPK